MKYLFKKAGTICLVSLFVFFSLSCRQVANFSSPSDSDDQSGGQPESEIEFSGLESFSATTDSTIQLNWTSHVDAVGYHIYNVSSGTPLFVTFIFAPASNAVLSNLNPGESYSFQVRAQDVYGFLDMNQKIEDVTMNLAPNSPSLIELVAPETSPGFDQTPILRVSGVKTGDVVRVFTDSSCSTEVGQVTSSGSSVEVTTSTLASGSYTFYANSTGENSSLCSTINLNYEISSCPSGYTGVPGDINLSVSSFCIMEYEAKAWSDSNADGIVDSGEVDSDGCNEGACTTSNWGTATYKPGSATYGHPWRRIDQNTAWSECDSLNTEGSRGDIDNDVNTDGTYALVSNLEWMALAHNIEMNPNNWTSNEVGEGCLYRGNIGSAFVCDGVTSSYNYGGPDSGARAGGTTARLELSTGEIVWDLSGNVMEWVDWDISSSLTIVTPANKAYVSGDTAPVNAMREFPDLDSNISSGNEMESSTWQPLDTSLTSANGIGQYYAGVDSSGGSALRGGFWSHGLSAGLYALTLYTIPTYTSTAAGFRCVFRP